MNKSYPMNISGAKLSALTVSSLLFLSPVLLAQDNENDAEELIIEEVIVTATYREASVQDLSLAITALTAETLENMGATEIQDYYRTVPNFTVVDRGPGLRMYTLRGISTGIVTQSAATVGVYLNEIPLSAAGFQPDIKLFDLERVEVLRGPQGTLFGEGSMGGTLRMITPDPDPSGFFGKAEGSYSSTTDGGNNFNGAAMVNVPIVEDSFAIRASAYYYDWSGFIDRIPQPDGVQLDFGALIGLPPGSIPPVLDSGPIDGANNINDEETKGGRISMLWKATDKLSFELGYLSQDSDFGGKPVEANNVGKYKTDFILDEVVSDEVEITSLSINYDFGWANLLSATSLWDRTVDRLSDNADLGNSIFPGAKLAGVGTATEEFQDQITQEFRLTSKGGGRLEWIAGFYYVDKDDGFNQWIVDDLDFFIDFVNILGIPLTDARQLLDLSGDFEETQTAFYGELDYQFNDRWSGTVGLRYFDYEQTTTIINNDINALGLGLQDGVYDGSDSGTTSKFSLRYTATDNVMIYATAAEGFRIGGVNTAPGIPDDQIVFGPDSLWSYELGAKTSSSDGRWVFNAAVFYVDWTDIQLALPIGFSFGTVNSGEAQVTGAEFELSWRPIDKLDITASLGLNDGELSEDVPEANNPDNPNPGFKGDTLPGVADMTGSLSMQYTSPIEQWDMDWFVRGDYQYTGDSQTTFNELSTANFMPSHFKLDAYSILNLRLGLRGERWGAYLFANNVTDERAVILRDNAAFALRTTRNRPRTIGVKVTANF